MPRFDGTGPKGEGSQTGRRMGKCSSKVDRPNNAEESGAGRRTSRRGKRLFGRRNGNSQM